MPQSTVRLNQGPNRKLIAALVAAALAAGAAAVWWSGRSQAPQPNAQNEGAAFPWGGGDAATKVAADVADLKLSPEEAHRQQQAAADAARKQVGARELTGPITERPEFVSQLEWVVLRQVAQRAPDSDKELTRLVNSLRFMKHLELWRSLAGSPDVQQRHAVAEQLLAQLPSRVAIGEISKPDGLQLQGELLADLVADPGQRAQRAAEEAKRLVEPPAPAREASAAQNG